MEAGSGDLDLIRVGLSSVCGGGGSGDLDLIRVGLSSVCGGSADLKPGLSCGDIDLSLFLLCRRSSRSRFRPVSADLDMDG